MLVLSRKDGERLFIGGDVSIEVVCARNGKVRLAISAPSNVTVLREELNDLQLKQRVEAAAD